MQPILMINEAVEAMSRRLVGFGDLSPWAVRPEVVQQGPRADIAFGRSPMSMKGAAIVQPASHAIHVPVKHVAGAVGLRVFISQDKALDSGS